MAAAERITRNFNLLASFIIPTLLCGAVGYVTWVFVVLVCVKYFIGPSSSNEVPRREGIAIVFLVLYFLLLILMACCYLRLLYVIATNPGYVVRSRVSPDNDSRPSPKPEYVPLGAHLGASTMNNASCKSNEPNLDYLGIIEGRTRPPVGLEEVYKKDAYICDVHGLPIFCNSCWVWKPDRAHHCSEVNHCVRRMDHYCPWVGGIISETTMKFFMQFVFYAFIFCIFTLASTAFAVFDRQNKIGDVSLHWIICLTMATLFALLSFGMTLNTLQLAIKNHTTVERLWKGDRAYYVALLISDRQSEEIQSKVGYSRYSSGSEKPKLFHTIQFPLRSENYSEPNNIVYGRQNGNTVAIDGSLPQAKRTFAVVNTSVTDNPWNLGPLENMKEILGSYWLDWFIPIRHSPHCDHSRDAGHFRFGFLLQALRKESGLME